ncbi:hypothetical protein ACIBG8_19990 [Nonomuraea sp. NPDC050556]|uniref:hypothetical protein n=1 Tax=Nonomuraea sp. NPDC050556 TaxID=3364369 RepID=UPI0037BDE152
MSPVSGAVGRHAMIVSLLHSHARTRACGKRLLGHQGVIVGVLRNGTTALIELDDVANLPAGVRRWPVHWDDLQVEPVPPPPAPHVITYRAGISGTGDEAVQHAVLRSNETSLCGAEVHPLPICGWAFAFTPAIARTCPTCARLVETAP